MIRIYRFTLHPDATLDAVWEELEAAGWKVLYSSEEPDGIKEIYAQSIDHPLINPNDYIQTMNEVVLPDIDWTEQWKLHAPCYQDGAIQLDLTTFGCQASNSLIRLQPGPGFGDLSHPTTRLMLRLMANAMEGALVIDIGTGSGILAVAAAAMGAQIVYAIDIDREALKHTRKNAQLNAMDAMIVTAHPEEWIAPSFEKHPIALMNMIWSEQEQAWNALSFLHPYLSMLYTSGVREEERTAYLETCQEKGWQLKQMLEEEGWCGFIFHTKPPAQR